MREDGFTLKRPRSPTLRRLGDDGGHDELRRKTLEKRSRFSFGINRSQSISYTMFVMGMCLRRTICERATVT